MRDKYIRLILNVDNKSHVMRKPVLAIANNKGANQPVQPRSLISAFVVRFRDSIIPILASCPSEVLSYVPYLVVMSSKFIVSLSQSANQINDYGFSTFL